MKPRVTWLLPVKNGMPYLPETLASIEAQTYTNWEILAWDNGSTDGTLEVLQEWIPSRLPGRIISDRPMGLGASLAAMVELADTDLCARIDADDINLPERLEAQVEYLNSNPVVALVSSQTEFIDDAGKKTEKIWNRPTSHLDIMVYMLWNNPVAHPAVLFRRQAIIELGNFRDLKPGQDYDMWLRLGQKYRIVTLPEILLRYRVHENSISHVALVTNKARPLVEALQKEYTFSVYGCSMLEMQMLRNQTHPLAIVPLMKIATRLHFVSGEPVRNFFRVSCFEQVVRPFIAKRDWVTRIIVSLLQNGISGNLQKLNKKRASLLYKIQPQKVFRQG